MISSLTMVAAAWIASHSLPQGATAEVEGTVPLVAGEVVTELSKKTWAVFQTRNGDYWFGSNGDGAYRYDGKTITRYTTRDGLPGDDVRGFQEDANGLLYIESTKDIGTFDGKAFTILAAVASNEWRLEKDDLWFKGDSHHRGPFRYDGKTLHALKFPKHPLEDALDAKETPITSPYAVYTIYEDRSGAIWFGTAILGACRYDGKTWKWIYEKELTYVPSGGSFGIRSIIEDAAGKFWICNTHQRFAIDPQGSSPHGKDFVAYTKEAGIEEARKMVGEDGFYFQSIFEGADGALYMTPYGGGVFRYDGGSLTNYPVQEGATDLLMISTYKDRSGGMWVATEDAGPFRFDGKSFRPFRP